MATPHPLGVALARARAAANRSGIDTLRAEVERAEHTLALPAARLIARGEERPLVLSEVETVLASQHLVIDACRRVARSERCELALFGDAPFCLRCCACWPKHGPARRPARFSASARFVPDARTSRTARGSASSSAACAGKLRSLADVRATPAGFALLPRSGEVRVLGRCRSRARTPRCSR